MRYNITVRLVELTGGGPDTFAEISKDHISFLQESIGIEHHCVLEIGCGIGRVAVPLTQVIKPPGSCTGVEIINNHPWIGAVRIFLLGTRTFASFIST